MSWSRSPGTPLPGPGPLLPPLSRSEHDSRYLRFNDGHRTMSLQLPSEEYARTKACVDAWAAALPSDETGALGPAPL